MIIKLKTMTLPFKLTTTHFTYPSQDSQESQTYTETKLYGHGGQTKRSHQELEAVPSFND